MPCLVAVSRDRLRRREDPCSFHPSRSPPRPAGSRGKGRGWLRSCASSEDATSDEWSAVAVTPRRPPYPVPRPSPRPCPSLPTAPLSPNPRDEFPPRPSIHASHDARRRSTDNSHRPAASEGQATCRRTRVRHRYRLHRLPRESGGRSEVEIGGRRSEVGVRIPISRRLNSDSRLFQKHHDLKCTAGIQKTQSQKLKLIFLRALCVSAVNLVVR